MITNAGSPSFLEAPDLTFAERQAVRSYERRDQFSRNLSLSCVSLTLTAVTAFSRGETAFAALVAGSVIGVLLTAVRQHGYNELIERLESQLER